MKETESKTGIELIAEERREQLSKHCYNDRHDLEHDHEELALGAIHCIQAGRCDWPWTDSKSPVAKGRDRIHQLKVAGALVAAEIDRLIKIEHMSKRLTSERRAEIERSLAEPYKYLPVDVGRELLAEIDALNAELTDLRFAFNCAVAE